jgi:hypothetical protein
MGMAIVVFIGMAIVVFIGMVFSEHCTCELSYRAAMQPKKSCYPHHNYITWGIWSPKNLLQRAAV